MARVVRLANDYGAHWPLWTRGLSVLRRDAWPVSDDLAERISAWARSFAENYSEVDGWPTEQLKVDHVKEGHKLAVLLQSELGAEWVVRLEIWERTVRSS